MNETEPNASQGQPEHSPTPWMIGFSDGSGADEKDGIWINHITGSDEDIDYDVVIRGGCPEGDFRYGVQNIEDARFIVRAVNAHASLLTACEAALKLSGYASSQEDYRLNNNQSRVKEVGAEIESVNHKIINAIKQARAGQ